MYFIFTVVRNLYSNYVRGRGMYKYVILKYTNKSELKIIFDFKYCNSTSLCSANLITANKIILMKIYFANIVNPVQPFKSFCKEYIQNSRLDGENMFYTILEEFGVRFL